MLVILAVLAMTGCRIGFDQTSLTIDAVVSDASSRCQIEAITAGLADSCLLTSDDTLYCWGQNGHGQLGTGDFLDRPTPTLVPLDRVVGISAGVEETTCALRDDGTVWCWGSDTEDELTDHLLADNSHPTQIVDVGGQPFSNVLEVTVGEQHVCARRADGLWCWGWDTFGQIGDQVSQQRVSNPVHSLANVDGELASYGHTCAWTGADRAIRCWGDNDAGQIGDGNNVTPVFPPTSVGLTTVLAGASSYRHTCVVLASGAVDCWGINDEKQLGDNTTLARPFARNVLAQGGAAFDGAVDVGAGDNSACARRDDGTVWCWGGGEQGQLGNGTYGPSGVPVEVALAQPAKLLAVGNDHACAVLVDGFHVQCWGDNSTGELGNNMATNSAVPVDTAFTCP